MTIAKLHAMIAKMFCRHEWKRVSANTQYNGEQWQIASWEEHCTKCGKIKNSFKDFIAPYWFGLRIWRWPHFMGRKK